MAKQLSFNEEARKEIQKGVNTLADKVGKQSDSNKACLSRGSPKNQWKGGIFDCLGEVSKGESLIGQIPLEDLDLVVDMTTKRLMHNPKSPDIPMAEIL
ncbi:MAG: hypothetical protein AB1397_07855 [bacterium]